MLRFQEHASTVHRSGSKSRDTMALKLRCGPSVFFSMIWSAVTFHSARTLRSATDICNGGIRSLKVSSCKGSVPQRDSTSALDMDLPYWLIQFDGSLTMSGY